MRPWVALRVLAPAALFSACLAATPNTEDAMAPQDFYAQVRPEPSKCGRSIEVVPSGTFPSRPFQELSRMSATCSPGAKSLCERRLEQRACALGADAVILDHAQPGAVPPGASPQSQISLSGRAVRWEE